MLKFFDRLFKWLLPGMKIKRWLILSWVGLLIFSLGFILIVNAKGPIEIEIAVLNILQRLTGRELSPRLVDYLFAVTGFLIIIFGIRQGFSSLYHAAMPYEQKRLVELVYERRQLRQGLKIVAIGGGTGLSSLLSGLKEHTGNLTAVVTVTDDGGSSGRLRKELGVIPPGDLRNCLVALADDESFMSELFQFRFSDGEGLGGHNFGNLFLVAMTSIAGDFERALKMSSKILAVRGRVLPSTLTPPILCAVLSDSSVVEGETTISKAGKPIREVFLKPAHCPPVPEVLQAIREADAIIYGPGSLYTSVLPNLLIDGVPEAIKGSRAIKIYVCNVMTQPGETDRFTASDHVRTILEQIGEQIFDYVLINDKMPARLSQKYEAEGAFPVRADREKVEEMGLHAICANLISETNMVRHDSKKLADILNKLILEVTEEKPSEAKEKAHPPSPRRKAALKEG
ncbi:MAG: gluconeogenesis factor YvcK family protein [bacterium]